MKTPTQDELKEFCQLARVHWHEWEALPYSGGEYIHCKNEKCNLYDKCVDRKYAPQLPDFSDPREVLKVMMKRKNWDAFLRKFGASYFGYTIFERYELININLITEPYALFYAALEWLRKEKK